MKSKIILFLVLLPWALLVADSPPPVYGTAFDKAISTTMIQIQTIRRNKDDSRMATHLGYFKSNSENGVWRMMNDDRHSER
jgi:hypothetical protein